MKSEHRVRYGWLKGMYLYTAIGAGLTGLAMLVLPQTAAGWLRLPTQDPVIYGIVASSFLAYGLLSLLGLKYPLRLAPILLLQMTYKLVWFVGVILPLVICGDFPSYAWIQVVLFASFIAGDLVAIPFRYLFTASEAA